MMERHGKIYIKMRKLIVKYLFFSYIIRLFGKQFYYVRAANVIIPLGFLYSYFMLNDGHLINKNSSILTWVSLVVFVLSILITFFYFRFKPAKWYELDTEQKFFFGTGALSGKTKEKLTTGQLLKFRTIEKGLLNETKKFKNVKTFLVPIISLILFVLVLL